MRLTVLGCAGSFPRADSPCSSYLLEADGFRLLVDLGNGALGSLQRHGDLYGVDAVVLSHLHGDHWLDLPTYVVARTYRPEGPLPGRLLVYGPAGTAARLDAASGGPQDSAVDVRTLAPGDLELGPFRLQLHRVNHPVETYGMRVEQGGSVLAYSADTGPCDALQLLATGADALLCEASFLQRPDNPPDLHLTGAEAGQYATRAAVGRLLLTHLVAWNDPLRTREEAASTYAGPVTAVTPGQVLDI